MNKKLLLFVLIILTSCNLLEEKCIKFDRHLRTFHDFNQFNGSALVSENGKDIFNSSYGKIKINKGNRIDEKSIFPLLKISRLYTAALTIKLIEDKKLNPKATVSDFILPFKVIGGHRITVLDLLRRKSGLSEISKQKDMKYINSQFLLTKNVFKALKKCNLIESVGEKISNETTDYIILGKIIESATGLSFKKAMEKYLFEKIKLQNTYFIDENKEVKGFYKGAGRFVENKIEINRNLIPVCGISSSINDLNVFLNLLFSKKYIDKSFLNELFKYDEEKNTNWGGFYNGPFNMDIFYCSSELKGYRAQVFYMEKSNDLIILLSNLNSVPPYKFDIVNGLIASLYNLPINEYLLPKSSLTDYLSINYGKMDIKELIRNARSKILSNKKSFVLEEDQLVLFCKDLVQLGKTDEAIEVGIFATQLKPKSSKLYLNLASLYSVKNDFENAKKYCQVAYELNQWNRDAIDLLQRLKKGEKWMIKLKFPTGLLQN